VCSPKPENAGGEARTSTAAQEFSSEERALLLKLAHEAIAAAVEGRPHSPTPPSPHLAQPRGAFTTIYHRGDLRGCVGYVLPVHPLFQTVAETARSAALEDTRFWPVTREELPELAVSLSILSPLKPIQPEEVEIGRHGLLVSLGSHRGLLLPQVPAEHGWDRITFLEHTCRKAGLPVNAWQKGAKLEAFTAEVFGDQGAEG
jgi:AmmeMemoRadiSam system protein A